jgi:hypothetical protein
MECCSCGLHGLVINFERLFWVQIWRTLIAPVSSTSSSSSSSRVSTCLPCSSQLFAHCSYYLCALTASSLLFSSSCNPNCRTKNNNYTSLYESYFTHIHVYSQKYIQACCLCRSGLVLVDLYGSNTVCDTR